MKKKLFLTILLVVFASITLFFVVAGKAGHPEQLKIKIIETSDVHGSIFPWDFKNDKPAKTSLAQISTYVNEQRANKDQEVILIDDGDLLQGQPIVYYYNFEKLSRSFSITCLGEKAVVYNESISSSTKPSFPIFFIQIDNLR